MSSVRTTVFRGTVFLGSRIVRRLAEAGGRVRIAPPQPGAAGVGDAGS